MPYFVVIWAMERPATIRPGDSRRIDVRALETPYATLAEAEHAARRQAELEQEYPWTAVYVVEAPHWRRAQHLSDPNDHEYHRLHGQIHRATMADPEGRVPMPAKRLSAFQPPTAPPGRPAPSALPPATFSDSTVQRALDMLAKAGFETIVHDRSAYFEDRPQYAATVAATERMRAEVMSMGGPSVLRGEQHMQDLLFHSLADVRVVAQRYDLYERDGEYDIGDFSVYEFREGGAIDAFLEEVEQKRDGRLSTRQRPQRPDARSYDLKRLVRFQTDRLLVTLRLWSPSENQHSIAVAALQPVLGPATPLE